MPNWTDGDIVTWDEARNDAAPGTTVTYTRREGTWDRSVDQNAPEQAYATDAEVDKLLGAPDSEYVVRHQKNL